MNLRIEKNLTGRIDSVNLRRRRKISLAKDQQTGPSVLSGEEEEEELVAFDERFFRNKRREVGGRKEGGEFRDPRNDGVASRFVFFRIGRVSQTSDYSFQNGAI